jgi:hypothetical protein
MRFLEQPPFKRGFVKLAIEASTLVYRSLFGPLYRKVTGSGRDLMGAAYERPTQRQGAD